MGSLVRQYDVAAVPVTRIEGLIEQRRDVLAHERPAYGHIQGINYCFQAREGAQLLCELLDARLSETRRRAEILALAIITIDGFDAIVSLAETPVLAFCRTGTRSTTLWALTQASEQDNASILATAEQAGYDLSALADRLDQRRDQ